VLEQPADQHCAVLGGIMAVRMKVLGVRGVLVNGRVRDLAEINECKLPVCVLPNSRSRVLGLIDVALGEGDVDGWVGCGGEAGGEGCAG
jgi:regulator of RNase E activity RraA